MQSPSPNGSNGRLHNGRFATGNAGGPGNPHAKCVARLRSSLYRAIKPNDVHDVLQALLTTAKAGDVAAARELLQRVLGPPEAIDLIDRIEALEQKLNEIAEQRSRS